MRDMTKGNITQNIIFFAIPLFIASIFQQLYSIVDTIIVSRTLGSDALAGVGATGQPTFLLLCIALGMGNGGGLIISQCFGSKNFEKLKRVIISMAYSMLALALTMSALGLVFSEKMLLLLNVPNDILPYSISYIRIIFVFSTGTVLFNYASSILRSTGDSKTPLYALIAASFINTGLDLFFIIVLHLGVSGAAFATVISQYVSGLICLFVLYKNRKLLGFTQKARLLPELEICILIAKTSLPSVLQSCMITLGGISVQRLINSFGADTMAGYVAASKVDSLAIQVILSVGNALCVFTGQNIGKPDYERIKKALLRSMFIMVTSAAIIAICAYYYRFSIINIFIDTNANKNAAKTGAEYLSIVCIAYLICAIMQSYQNVIRGAGDVNTCMIAGIAELSGKILFAYIAVPFLGPTGIWISTPFSWACGCLVPTIRYYSGKWKHSLLT
jgi:putative MATE family efflux protein